MDRMFDFIVELFQDTSIGSGEYYIPNTVIDVDYEDISEPQEQPSLLPIEECEAEEVI